MKRLIISGSVASVILLFSSLTFAPCLLAESFFQKEQKSESAPVQTSLPVQLSGYAQVQFAESNTQVDSFSVRRARLILGFQPVKKLSFKLQADLVKSPVLADALVELNLDDKFNLRVGQFKVPFSLESITSAAELLTINRSQTVELLAPGRDNGASGRDIGAVVFGHLGFINYAAGLFNGAGINKKDDNDHKDFACRMTFVTLKKIALGFSLYNGRQTVSGNPTNLVRNRYGLEAKLDFQPFYLSSELIRARDGQTEKQGCYLQAALDLIKGKYQLILKLDSLNLDLARTDQKSRVYTFGANWYLSPKSKVQANLEYHHSDSGPDYRTLLLQLQVGF